MFDRIVGVFKLDVDTFEEIEADRTATSQAALVVLVVAVLAGIGSSVSALYVGDGGTDISSVGAFFQGFLGTFLGWIAWSAVTYLVGTSLFGGKADMGEMLRVIGFAYAPQMLGIIPCIGGLIGAVWTLIAGFVAVRQGLDLDNTKAFLTILVGFFAYVAVWIVLAFLGSIGSLM